jgi:DNA-binding transcriptional ArsR family regulator
MTGTPAPHEGLGITESDWAVFVDHTVATLNDLGVPEQEKDEFLAAAGALKDDNRRRAPPRGCRQVTARGRYRAGGGPAARGRAGKTEQDRLNAVFGALSDPTRRAIVARLAQGECSVTTLAGPFDVSAPAISKHLGVLERAGLIDRRKTGRVRYCRLRPDALEQAGGWIDQQRAFWEQQLGALERFLREEGP